MQEFRKISVVAEQHALAEFPGMNILKASYLLAGTDAGTNHRPLIFSVVRTLFHFSSEHLVRSFLCHSDDSEPNGFRCGGEGREGCGGIFEVEHLGITVVFVIHLSQAGIGVQHGFPGFHPIILHQFPGNTYPGPGMKRADLRLGIGQEQFGHRLDFPRLDVQFALKNVGSSKGTDPGLIILLGCQIVGSGFFQK